MSDARRAATPSRKFSEPHYIVLLALLLGSQPIATDLYLPALPAIAAELGNPALTLTGLTLAFGAAQLILGPLSDRFGRRPVLLAGCAAYALTSFAGAWVTSLAALVVCRCLQGAAMAALVVCARASVRDLYTPVEGAKALSRGLTGLGIFALSAPLVGALVVAQFSWHAAFVALGIFGMAVFAWVWFFFGESLPPRTPVPDADAEVSATRAVLGDARFRAWTAVLAASYSTLFCFLLSSGFVYIKVFGFSPLGCGLVLAGNSLSYIADLLVPASAQAAHARPRGECELTLLDRRWLADAGRGAGGRCAAGVGDDRGSVSDRDRARRKRPALARPRAGRGFRSTPVARRRFPAS